MNGLGKPLRKNPIKNKKNSKNQGEIAEWEQKTTSKAHFCSNTVFSLYFKIRATKVHSNTVFSLYFKIRATKVHAAKPLAFFLHFLFRRDQNPYSNSTSKIMKMGEQILTKRQRPNTNQIILIVNKKHSRTSPDGQLKEI